MMSATENHAETLSVAGLDHIGLKAYENSNRKFLANVKDGLEHVASVLDYHSESSEDDDVALSEQSAQNVL